MSLSPELAAKVAEVVAQVDGAAERAERSAADATSGVSSWWQGLLGTSSSAEALASLAHSQRSLADAVRARAGRLNSDGEALAFIQDAQRNGWAVLSGVEELARFLSFGGGVSTIAGDSARDLGTMAKIGAPLLVVLIGALAMIKLGVGGRRS